MYRQELLDRMQRIIGNTSYGSTDTELLSGYLDIAAEKILNRRYPFGVPDGAQVEPQYIGVQLEIAVHLFNRRGTEGESLHSENGIFRSFGGYTDVPPELLMRVTPKGRVV